METWRVYGDHRSGNCYKVALILALTGRPYHWVEVDVMSGETQTPGFLDMNPNGKVPLLQTPAGRFLPESNAILLHLAEGSDYLPADAWQRARVYQWLFFEQYTHEPSIAVARFIVYYAGRELEEAERLAELRGKGRRALSVMEKNLAGSAYMAGPQFTIADIALYAYTHVAEDGGIGLAEFPAVRAWLERVAAVPGFKAMAEACR